MNWSSTRKWVVVLASGLAFGFVPTARGQACQQACMKKMASEVTRCMKEKCPKATGPKAASDPQAQQCAMGCMPKEGPSKCLEKCPPPPTPGNPPEKKQGHSRRG